MAQALKSTSQGTRGILFEAATSQGSAHRTHQPSRPNLPQPGFHSHDNLEFHCLDSNLPAKTWGSVFSNGDDRQVGVSNDSELASNWAMNCPHATGTSPFSAGTPSSVCHIPLKTSFKKLPHLITTRHLSMDQCILLRYGQATNPLSLKFMAKPYIA